jgi:hypothetical protein
MLTILLLEPLRHLRGRFGFALWAAGAVWRLIRIARNYFSHNSFRSNRKEIQLCAIHFPFTSA